MEPTAFYQERIKQLQDKRKKTNSAIGSFAFLRFALFILIVTFGIIGFNTVSFMMFGLSAISVLLFIVFVFLQQRKKQELAQTDSLIVMNENEIKAINGDCSSFDKGAEFIDAEHPYTFDLDIFGDKSLFQLINRCSTFSGRKKLSEWLSAPLQNADEITKKQDAVKELSTQQEWIQDLRLLLQSDKELSYYNAFTNWLSFPELLLKNKTAQILARIMPLLAVGLLIGSFFLPLWNYFLTVFIINAVILILYKKPIAAYTELSTHAEQFIISYKKSFEKIEQTQFTSEKLKALAQQLSKNGDTVSKTTAQLAKNINLFEQRNNAVIYFPINVLLLADLHLISSFEKWKQHHSEDVKEWIDCLSEFESLGSFATVTFNHPRWNFPTISSNRHIIISEAGHPLIPETERVNNDFALQQSPYFMLVTGSNMAGKSSYLRTIGINLVLAMNGSPVCAKTMEFFPVEIFSSMRIVDSLTDNISSFYAELRRIKRIIKLSEEKENCFFLLDEILRGTNSHDRHIGSKSLIVQLLKNNSCGAIATHDIELGNLEENSNNSLENYSFDVQVKNNKLFFDYKIKRGICTSLNASQLMAEAGIELQK